MFSATGHRLFRYGQQELRSVRMQVSRREAKKYTTDFLGLLESRWSVCLTVQSAALRNKRVTDLTNWYATKTSTILLDHHPNAALFREQALAVIRHTGMGLNPSKYSNSSRQQREQKLANQPPVTHLHMEDFPLLFVNKQYIGTVRDLECYLQEGKLKDLLQFGFLWKDTASGGDTGRELGSVRVAAQYKDEALYHSLHRGHAKLSQGGTIAQLPKFSPLQKNL